ncbi:MAG: sensor domain-containing diguanylate cyclase [Burkholderiales bacterium]|nr:sensor domain-containing diguanylate cyclase [Burkholderiales bacterium]
MNSDHSPLTGVSRLEEDNTENPQFWEPSHAFIKYAIAFLLVGSAVFMLVIHVFTPDQTARYYGPIAMFLMALTTWLVLACGGWRPAVYMLAVGVWLTITGISMFNGGVRTPIIIAYPTSIILIGWLISTRTALVAAALTVSAIIGFEVADSWAILPAAPPTPSTMHGIVQILVVAISTLLIVLLVKSYQNRVREVSRLGNDLALRAAELETHKSELQQAQAVASIGSWVCDLATQAIRLSAETSRIFGVPGGIVQTYGAYRAKVCAQDLNAVTRAWQGALKGEKLDHEYRIVVGDTTRWIREKAELEFAADGTAVRAVGIAQDITERKQMEHQVHLMAFHDELTGLPNRRLLGDRLSQVMAASKRTGLYGALMFLDLDKLKVLNDSHGHKVGDLLLVEAADRLRSCVREMDTVARFSGDEFVVMLPELDTDKSQSTIQARIVAEKIRAALARPYEFVIQHEGKAETSVEHRCTASIGVVLFIEQKVGRDEILKRADAAMYQAKNAGGDAIRFYDSLVLASAPREQPADRSA